MTGKTGVARRRLGWVLLLGLSAVAAVLLVVHLVWPGRVDAITLVLLVLVALPGLGLVLDSAELPGGVKVQFRQLEQRVQRNEATADAAMGAATAQAALTRRRAAPPVPASPLAAVPPSFCTRCGAVLTGRFCAVCGTDSGAEAAPSDGTAWPGVTVPSQGMSGPAGDVGPASDAGFGGPAEEADAAPDAEFAASPAGDVGAVPDTGTAGPAGNAGMAADSGVAGPSGEPAVPPSEAARPAPAADDARVLPVERGDRPGPVPARPDGDTATVARLAGEYEQLRRRMPGGPRRTALMTDLFGKLITATVADPYFDPSAALASVRPGLRLAGYANAYGQPDAALLGPLRIAVRIERLPFNQYWGLRALRRVLEALPAGVAPPAGLAAELTDAYRGLRGDPSRDVELAAILALLT